MADTVCVVIVRLLWLAGVLIALVLAAPAGAATPESSSTALGVRVVVQGALGATSVAVASPPRADAAADGFSFPAGGGVVTSGRLAVESRARLAPDPGSFARADVRGVSLFAGEITASRVYVQAGSRATLTAAGGQLSASTIEELVVLGEPVDVRPNQQLPLGDWGYAVVLEQAVVTEGLPTPGFRGFVVGLHVHLTAEHGGLPAGSEILIGYAEAAVRSSGVVRPRVERERAEPEPAAAPRLPEPTNRRPPPARPERVEQEAPEVTAQFTGDGLVFPVYGPASFTDEFGAARASTGWHHGNDIFAQLGAPVLAVTAGELFLVGWNAVGGHRLWLRDDSGNEYYFAHLSAYTPVAKNGARVEAGDVLGFVGASGDAVGTPPHLHFEIHPLELFEEGYDGVINPFRFLSAWRQALDADVSFTFAGPDGTDAPGSAPLPAAVPLGYVDISSASGLDSGGLERVLSFPSAVAGQRYSLLVLPRRSPIIASAPGFSAR